MRFFWSVPKDIEAVSVRQFRFKRHTQPMVPFLGCSSCTIFDRTRTMVEKSSSRLRYMLGQVSPNDYTNDRHNTHLRKLAVNIFKQQSSRKWCLSLAHFVVPLDRRKMRKMTRKETDRSEERNPRELNRKRSPVDDISTYDGSLHLASFHFFCSDNFVTQRKTWIRGRPRKWCGEILSSLQHRCRMHRW